MKALRKYFKLPEITSIHMIIQMQQGENIITEKPTESTSSCLAIFILKNIYFPGKLLKFACHLLKEVILVNIIMEFGLSYIKIKRQNSCLPNLGERII